MDEWYVMSRCNRVAKELFAEISDAEVSYDLRMSAER